MVLRGGGMGVREGREESRRAGEIERSGREKGIRAKSMSAGG